MDTSLALMTGGLVVSLYAVIHTKVGRGPTRMLLTALVTVVALAPAFAAYAQLGPPQTRLGKSSAGVFTSSTSVRSSAIYTVVRGDTLWKIAASDLSARRQSTSSSQIASRWRSIYDGNRSVIGDDPNLIFPGQRYDMGDR
jgi:nucleoid-associated protein YgaU